MRIVGEAAIKTAAAPTPMTFFSFRNIAQFGFARGHLDGIPVTTEGRVDEALD
jgi:hypothetical protein